LAKVKRPGGGVNSPSRLTYPQYLVTLVLGSRTFRPVKDIGERLLLDSGTLTLLKRMESAGLIRRQRDRADERVVRISLSNVGQSSRERAGGDCPG
jgi:MarR family transcriptional regulator, organic hydroperoxide resistance regulator